MTELCSVCEIEPISSDDKRGRGKSTTCGLRCSIIRNACSTLEGARQKYKSIQTADAAMELFTLGKRK